MVSNFRHWIAARVEKGNPTVMEVPGPRASWRSQSLGTACTVGEIDGTRWASSATTRPVALDVSGRTRIDGGAVEVHGIVIAPPMALKVFPVTVAAAPPPPLAIMSPMAV